MKMNRTAHDHLIWHLGRDPLRAPSHRFRPFGTSLPRQMVSRVAELEAKVNVHWERRGCAL